MATITKKQNMSIGCLKRLHYVCELRPYPQPQADSNLLAGAIDSFFVSLAVLEEHNYIISDLSICNFSEVYLSCWIHHSLVFSLPGYTVMTIACLHLDSLKIE